MAHRGKTYQAIKAKAPAAPVDLAAAVAFCKEHARSTFDESIELHLHLNIDPAKSDQIVRGTVDLPSGAPKQKRIAVFAETKEQQQAALAAGASLVGGEELITKISEEGTLAADITIATPAMMPKVARVARILGPRGLMPNPKTGTVTPDPATAVRELAGGKLSFKMDQLGNIHEAVGKASWEADRTAANAEALIDAVRAARPATIKGRLIDTITVVSTMGPAVRVVLV